MKVSTSVKSVSGRSFRVPVGMSMAHIWHVLPLSYVVVGHRHASHLRGGDLLSVPRGSSNEEAGPRSERGRGSDPLLPKPQPRYDGVYSGLIPYPLVG